MNALKITKSPKTRKLPQAKVNTGIMAGLERHGSSVLLYPENILIRSDTSSAGSCGFGLDLMQAYSKDRWACRRAHDYAGTVTGSALETGTGE